MHIQVPDCESMMYAYLGNGICPNVPHKPKNDDEVLKHHCAGCEGKGFVHPDRWLMAFCGAQKHRFDAHLNVFTPEKLIMSLKQAGFREVEPIIDKLKWKIKINAFK